MLLHPIQTRSWDTRYFVFFFITTIYANSLSPFQFALAFEHFSSAAHNRVLHHVVQILNALTKPQYLHPPRAVHAIRGADGETDPMHNP